MVERVVRVVSVLAAGSPAKDLFARVLAHLRGKHVLARVLVAPAADEALLVAVVDHRLPPGEEQQVVGQLGAGHQVGACDARSLQHHGGPAHVVVAEEGRQLVGVGVGVGVVVVRGIEVSQAGGGFSLRERESAALEAEVECGRQLAGRRVFAHHRRVGVVDLTKHEEVGVALGLGRGQNCRRKPLPEGHVDVLDGVDPEPVDAEVDPVLVDVRHPVDDLGLLGEEVVKADEVAVLR